jgi:hypothetical protein
MVGTDSVVLESDMASSRLLRRSLSLEEEASMLAIETLRALRGEFRLITEENTKDVYHAAVLVQA